MSLVGLLWVVLIALKIASVGAMTSVSWALVLLWPLVPIALFFLFIFIVAAIKSV